MHYYFILPLAFLLLVPPVLAQDDKDVENALLETPEEVLEANVDAVVGRTACEAVRSMQLSGIRISEGPMGGGKMTSAYLEHLRFPGFRHVALEMETPMGDMSVTQVVTPELAWVEAGPIGRRDMPTAPSPSLDSACPEIAILANPAFALSGLETDEVDATDAYVVSVVVAGRTVRRFYDQESLLLFAAERFSADAGEDEEPELVKYSQYRDVDGLLISHVQDEEVTMRMISRNGAGEETETRHRGASMVTVENVVINPDIDDSLFADE